MTKTLHPLVRDYLRRLDRTARALPRREREELVAEIRAHIDAGLASPDPGEADVRNLLDGLGTPEEIVRAAGGDADGRGQAEQRGIGVREAAALFFLVTGFPPLIGWIIGAVLMTSSPMWKLHHKLLGMLVWPGGLFFWAMLPAGGMRAEDTFCLSGACEAAPQPPPPSLLDNVGIAAFFAAPFVVAIYLVWVARRRSGAVSG